MQQYQSVTNKASTFSLFLFICPYRIVTAYTSSKAVSFIKLLEITLSDTGQRWHKSETEKEKHKLKLDVRHANKEDTNVKISTWDALISHFLSTKHFCSTNLGSWPTRSISPITATFLYFPIHNMHTSPHCRELIGSSKCKVVRLNN